MKKKVYLDNQDYRTLTQYTSELGAYKECISGRKERYNYLNIIIFSPFLLFTLPGIQYGMWLPAIIGGICFLTPILVTLIIWFIKRRKSGRVLIFEHGFILQECSFSGKTIEEYVYDYDEVIGMFMPRTRIFKRFNGIPLYQYTETALWVKTTDFNEYDLLEGRYSNKKEKQNGYNYYGHAIRTILNNWTFYLINKLQKDFNKDGYIIFPIADYGEIKFAKGYFELNDLRFNNSNTSNYLENGHLYLQYRQIENPEIIETIDFDINYMYNADAFLFFLNQYIEIN